MSFEKNFLELKKINKHFGEFHAIKDVDLNIVRGNFVVFVGPSGCGKSTLLRLIAGLESIDSGHLILAGKDITHVQPSKRNVAMVFQSYALYPHMKVEENMSFALRLARLAKETINAKVKKVAETLNLTPYLKRLPKELSGGQRQRVAIGRAIVREPKIFLFDEPLSNLDAALRTQTRVEIANLHKDLHATTIYVTHDQVEAMTLADQVVVLNQGEIEQVGPPLDLYDHPANLFVAQFIGTPQMNVADISLFPPAIQKELKEAARKKNIDPLLIDKVGFRPENLSPTPVSTKGKKAGIPGKIILIEHLGLESILYIETSAGTLSCRLNRRSPLRREDKVSLYPEMDKAHFFDNQGNTLMEKKSPSSLRKKTSSSKSPRKKIKK